MTPTKIVFTGRLGPDPHADGAPSPSVQNCPDILALDDGSFAVIGIDITARSQGLLPPTVSCGPDERIIWIPRSILTRAKPDIPAD
jgi:hypothetical protein